MTQDSSAPTSGARLAALRALLRLLALNLPLSLLLGLRYALHAPPAEDWVARGFLYLALLSNFVMLYAALGLVLALPVAALPRRGAFVALCTTVFTLFHLLTVIDTVIYGIFRFHLNGMVVNLFLTEGAWDSVRLGPATTATGIAVVVAAGALQVFLARRCYGAALRRAPTRPRTRRLVWGAAALVLGVLLADKLGFAVADLRNDSRVLRYEKVYPLYQPLTVKKLASRVLGISVDRESELKVGRTSGALRYPREALAPPKPAPRPNIVWILVDAWRYDMLDPEVAPNLYAFSKRCQVFDNHYSGGNATRFGVFSLFYGVYGTYWHSFLAERQSPVLIDELARLGYQFKILSSTRLTFPEFRKTAFVRIPGDVEDRLVGEGPAERDPKLAERFIQWLGERDRARPYFSFLFFDGPHGPYDYTPDFEKFRPAKKTANYATVGPADAIKLKNAYKNAILFDDHWVGRVLDALERTGALDDTVVVISGDHGEEFFESGFLGHNGAYTREQTGVPLLLYLPGVPPRRFTHRTSHLDVPATFLTLLGYETPPEVYSQGKPMLGEGRSGYVVASGWNDCAIIGDDHTIVFPTETYNVSRPEVRDRAYRLVADPGPVLKRARPELLEVARGFRDFLR